MPRWRVKLALAAGAAALSLAIPAFGQQAGEQDRPESLLPEGFGDPAPPAPSRPAPQPGTPAPGPANILPSTPAAPSSGVPLADGSRRANSARSNWRRSKRRCPSRSRFPISPAVRSRWSGR